MEYGLVMIWLLLQCFMNSILQCLLHTRLLFEYCASGQYKVDVNKESSAMKGALIAGKILTLTYYRISPC